VSPSPADWEVCLNCRLLGPLDARGFVSVNNNLFLHRMKWWRQRKMYGGCKAAVAAMFSATDNKQTPQSASKNVTVTAHCATCPGHHHHRQSITQTGSRTFLDFSKNRSTRRPRLVESLGLHVLLFLLKTRKVRTLSPNAA